MYTSRQGLPRPTLGLQAGAGGVVNPGSGNGGPNVIPSAPSGGAPWSDFVGELGTEIAKEGIGIVGDWIRSRLGGSSESTPADQVVPSNQPLVGTSTSKCGPGQIPFGQSCIDPLALPPGGKPAVTGAYTPGPSMDGYGAAVMGLYGLGLQPRVEVQTVRRCPGGMALGKDGICYEGLHRNSPRRAWPMGMKPLMTGGDRAAIAKAKRVATKLAGARKSISKTAKALAKAGC